MTRTGASKLLAHTHTAQHVLDARHEAILTPTSCAGDTMIGTDSMPHELPLHSLNC